MLSHNLSHQKFESLVLLWDVSLHIYLAKLTFLAIFILFLIKVFTSLLLHTN